jgi:hypothetical protein
MGELFARADPALTTATATAIPAAGTHKRQISEAVPRDERPNGPETTPAAPRQQEASGGSQGAQGADIGQAQALAQPITPARVAGPGSLNGVIEIQLQSNYSANGA